MVVSHSNSIITIYHYALSAQSFMDTGSHVADPTPHSHLGTELLHLPVPTNPGQSVLQRARLAEGL